MKIARWDQYEFDNPSAEQEFEVMISTPRNPRHRTLAAFAEDVIGKGAGRQLASPSAFSVIEHFRTDSQMLSTLAGISVAENCAWPCYVVTDEWNWRECLLDGGDAFIRYRWSTTA